MVLTSSRIRDAIWSMGFRKNDDVRIGSGNPGRIPEERFHEFLTNVFVPSILQLRENPAICWSTGRLTDGFCCGSHIRGQCEIAGGE
jgi:hypothetical protein